MGLDMYLNAKRYLWHNEEGLKQAIKAAIPDAPGEVKEVSVEACYWRKANHIHKWFVAKVQNGVDDCGHYYVSREQLKDLVDICKEVLEKNTLASVKLPSQSGFFFGGTDYDTYYFDDLKHTVKMLEPLVEPNKYKDWDFEYHSSW